MSHILGNTEVYLAPGASAWASIYFTQPPPTDNIPYLSWEPLSFWTELPWDFVEFSWTARVRRQGDVYYFEKLVTNTGTTDASFVFYYSLVP
jgi:hypothetical protein